MRYKESFRKAMVQKMLIPGGIGITQLSREIGVCIQTLCNWRQKYREGEISDRSPRQWKIKDKVDAVFEAAKLSDNELGRWLREKGLHSSHLEIWEKEIKIVATSSKEKEELRRAKKRIKELERDLQRKEKALAEVSALLVLKKKANILLEAEAI